MKAMTGQDKSQNSPINIVCFSENSELANAFNDFYSRFDDEYDFSIAYSNLCDRWGECSLTAPLTITASDVRPVLLKCNTRKNPGPDMITGKLLKVRCHKMFSVIYLINLLLRGRSPYCGRSPLYYPGQECITLRAE